MEMNDESREEKSSVKCKQVKRKRLKLSDIGEPQDFIHVVHVKPRPLAKVNLDDVDIKYFLQLAGVTGEHLKNPDVYETVVNFIHTHGVERVKQEIHSVAETIQVNDDRKSSVSSTSSSEENISPNKNEPTEQDVSRHDNATATNLPVKRRLPQKLALWLQPKQKRNNADPQTKHEVCDTEMEAKKSKEAKSSTKHKINFFKGFFNKSKRTRSTTVEDNEEKSDSDTTSNEEETSPKQLEFSATVISKTDDVFEGIPMEEVELRRNNSYITARNISSNLSTQIVSSYASSASSQMKGQRTNSMQESDVSSQIEAQQLTYEDETTKLYHEHKKEAIMMRQSWSFVMAELKQRLPRNTDWNEESVIRTEAVVHTAMFESMPICHEPHFTVADPLDSEKRDTGSSSSSTSVGYVETRVDLEKSNTHSTLLNSSLTHRVDRVGLEKLNAYSTLSNSSVSYEKDIMVSDKTRADSMSSNSSVEGKVNMEKPKAHLTQSNVCVNYVKNVDLEKPKKNSTSSKSSVSSAEDATNSEKAKVTRVELERTKLNEDLRTNSYLNSVLERINSKKTRPVSTSSNNSVSSAEDRVGLGNTNAPKPQVELTELNKDLTPSITFLRRNEHEMISKETRSASASSKSSVVSSVENADLEKLKVPSTEFEQTTQKIDFTTAKIVLTSHLEKKIASNKMRSVSTSSDNSASSGEDRVGLQKSNTPSQEFEKTTQENDSTSVNSFLSQLEEKINSKKVRPVSSSSDSSVSSTGNRVVLEKSYTQSTKFEKPIQKFDSTPETIVPNSHLQDKINSKEMIPVSTSSNSSVSSAEGRVGSEKTNPPIKELEQTSQTKHSTTVNSFLRYLEEKFDLNKTRPVSTSSNSSASSVEDTITSEQPKVQKVEFQRTELNKDSTSANIFLDQLQEKINSRKLRPASTSSNNSVSSVEDRVDLEKPKESKKSELEGTTQNKVSTSSSSFLSHVEDGINSKKSRSNSTSSNSSVSCEESKVSLEQPKVDSMSLHTSVSVEDGQVDLEKLKVNSTSADSSVEDMITSEKPKTDSMTSYIDVSSIKYSVGSEKLKVDSTSPNNSLSVSRAEDMVDSKKTRADSTSSNSSASSVEGKVDLEKSKADRTPASNFISYIENTTHLEIPKAFPVSSNSSDDHLENTVNLEKTSPNSTPINTVVICHTPSHPVRRHSPVTRRASRSIECSTSDTLPNESTEGSVATNWVLKTEEKETTLTPTCESNHDSSSATSTACSQSSTNSIPSSNSLSECSDIPEDSTVTLRQTVRYSSPKSSIAHYSQFSSLYPESRPLSASALVVKSIDLAEATPKKHSKILAEFNMMGTWEGKQNVQTETTSERRKTDTSSSSSSTSVFEEPIPNKSQLSGVVDAPAILDSGKSNDNAISERAMHSLIVQTSDTYTSEKSKVLGITFSESIVRSQERTSWPLTPVVEVRNKKDRPVTDTVLQSVQRHSSIERNESYHRAIESHTAGLPETPSIPTRVKKRSNSGLLKRSRIPRPILKKTTRYSYPVTSSHHVTEL